MSSTTFIDGATPVVASWLNDVNTATYTTVPALSTTVGTHTTQIASKAAAGANTDILSLASPSLGAATATTQTGSDNSTKVATTAQVQAAVALALGVPSGTIITVAMSTPPTGYLKANGSAVSRTTYASLFAAIGTTYGAGDGSTTFNVPEVRGEFIRGWDDGRGVDASRVLGSSQADQMQGHTHTVNPLYSSSGYGNGSIITATTQTAGQTNFSVTGPISDGTNGTPRTGSETRPRNVAFLVCIKT